MRKRITMECWKCHQTFSLTLDIQGQPQFVKACPFCGAQCVIDLNPYRRSDTEVLRGTEMGLEKEDLLLPDVIPTTESEAEA